MQIITDIKEATFGLWLFFGAFFGALTLFIGIAGTATIKSIAADGRGDFCYTEQRQFGEYTVQEHVPWRTDRVIGVFMNPVEAADFKAGVCP